MKKILEKMIKRRDFIKVAGIGAVGLAVGGFPSILRSAEKWNFKFASHEPATSLMNQSFWLWWCDRVEKLSDGAVKFDKFPAETLVKALDGYAAIRDGVTEAGLFVIPFNAGLIPLPTIKELPFSFVDYDTNYLMWREMMSVGLQDYFHSFGVHLVADNTLPLFSLWTTKRRGPIKNMDDLKGCKIRSPGGYMTKALAAMGGTVITMSPTESYTAMERGILDGTCIHDTAQITFRINEVAAYISRPDFGTTGVPICVNLKVWNSLPKNIQDIMLKAGRDAEINFPKMLERYTKEVIEPTILKSGLKVIPLPEKEREKMKKACLPVWDEWLAKNGDTFGGLGKKMFDIVAKSIGKQKM